MKKLAAAVILTAILAVPAFAADVTVSAFGVYESKYRGFEAKIVTPIVNGMADKKEQAKVNAKLAAEALRLAGEYNHDVSEMLADDPNTDAHLGCVSNFEIKTNNAKILAFDVYKLNIAGSSDTKRSFYVIDKSQRRLLTLREMFKKNADYVSVISKYIRGEMVRLNAKEKSMFWVDKSDMTPFKSIRPDQNFYVDSAGRLVICFDKYEVAAGAQGTPEFTIPNKVLANILAK